MALPSFPNPFTRAKVGRRESFEYDRLIDCAHGQLFGPENGRLPLPPMLMFDRIGLISDQGGQHGRGEMHAELNIHDDLWFFACHFENDPVMPGCLGLDAMWQLVGFFLLWVGGEGRGRALGVGNLKFKGQVEPKVSRVEYLISIKRIIKGKLWMGLADGLLKADGQTIYEAQDLKVGLFSRDQL